MPSSPDEFRSRDYPIREDLPLQRRLWAFERIGWYALGLIVLLTLLGAFGTGPLSWREARSADGALTVRFERFERNGASSQLDIVSRADAGTLVWITVEGDLPRRFTVEGIQPEPARTASTADGFRFALYPDPQGQAVAHLALRPNGVGPVRSSVGANGQRVAIGQFIYP